MSTANGTKMSRFRGCILGAAASAYTCVGEGAYMSGHMTSHTNAFPDFNGKMEHRQDVVWFSAEVTVS